MIMRKNLVAKSSTALLMISILTACSQEEMPLLGQPGTEGDIRLEKALGLAESMISSLEDGSTRSHARTLTSLTRLDGTRSDDEGGLYLANYGYDEGFALISTVPNTLPVLGFSDTGSLTPEDTVGNYPLQTYLNVQRTVPPLITDSVSWADGRQPGLPAIPPLEPSVYKIEVAPILARNVARWHTRSPFNSLCPDGTSVGCTPLAMGMLMTNYSWPASYGDMQYDWNQIRTSGWCDHVSHLLYAIRTAAKAGSSGAVTENNICPAFKKMGYKEPSIESFGTASQGLRSGNPVMMMGNAENESAGHAWIIDGIYSTYEPSLWWTTPAPTVYYYHSVWGWGGTSNGYFYYGNGKVSGSPAKVGDNDSDVAIDYVFYNFRSIGTLTH